MTRWLTMVVLVGTLACGAESDVHASLAADVRLDPLLRDETASMSVYVLGPRQLDGVFLSYDVLMTRTVRPDGGNVEVLAQTEIAITPTTSPEATLTGIAAGDNRFAYVEAKDATGQVIGNGCDDDVDVKSGEVVTAEVTVLRL